MSKRVAIAAAAAAAALGAVLGTVSAAPASAQGNEVLATVNGTDITRSDVTFAYDTVFADVLADLSEEDAKSRVLDLLIDLELMAEAARETGLNATPEFGRRMALVRKQALQDLYMTDQVERTVTREAVEQRYEALTEDFPFEEVNAAHILVETRDAAEDILAELEAGADFAELAAEHSMDPGTKQRGGSLGWFRRGRMVPAFEEAAFSLDPGATTREPVKSQFGWHIIRAEDRRTREAPPLEEVRERIREMLVRRTFRSAVDTLRQEADIDRPGGSAGNATADQ